jgi:hypothetical protein
VAITTVILCGAVLGYAQSCGLGPQDSSRLVDTFACGGGNWDLEVKQGAFSVTAAYSYNIYGLCTGGYFDCYCQYIGPTEEYGYELMSYYPTDYGNSVEFFAWDVASITWKGCANNDCNGMSYLINRTSHSAAETFVLCNP